MLLRRLLLSLLFSASLALGACGQPVTPEPDAGEEHVDDAGTGGGGEQDAGEPLPPTTFRAVTWNVENLFDEYDDPEDDTVLPRREVETRLDELAEVLESLGPPEIIALQEVENIGLLKRLASRLSGEYHAVLIDANDPRGIDVGLLTRFPVTREVSHASENVYDLQEPRKFYRFARDCLEVHLDVEGRKMVVLVSHLVSKAREDSDRKREAEAAKIRDIADYLRGEDPNRAVLIAGDMNDTPTSPALRQLLRSPDFVDVGESSPCTFNFGQSCFRYDYLLPDSTTAAGLEKLDVVKTSAARRASDHAPVVGTFTLSN